jgi:hypothetical protein
MSTCAQGVFGSTNSFRKIAPLIEPPYRPPVFLKSAQSERRFYL